MAGYVCILLIALSYVKRGGERSNTERERGRERERVRNVPHCLQSHSTHTITLNTHNHTRHIQSHTDTYHPRTIFPPSPLPLHPSLSPACRLPLFERRLGLLDESLESFHRCVSGNSVLKHYYPLPIQLGEMLYRKTVMVY